MASHDTFGPVTLAGGLERCFMLGQKPVQASKGWLIADGKTLRRSF